MMLKAMHPSSSNSPTSLPFSDDSSEPVFQAPWEAKAFAIVNLLASTHQL